MPPGSVSFSAEKALGTVRPRVQIAGNCGGVGGWDTERDWSPSSIHAMHPLISSPDCDFCLCSIFRPSITKRRKQKVYLVELHV